LLAAVTLGLLADEEAVERPAFGVITLRGGGGHWNRADLQSPHRLHVQIAGHRPEHVAEQPDRLGVEDRFLAVDVVTTLFSRCEGELAERNGPLLEEIAQTHTGGVHWCISRMKSEPEALATDKLARR